MKACTITPTQEKKKSDPKPFFIEYEAEAGTAEIGRQGGHVHDWGLRALTDSSLLFDLICMRGKLQM